MSQISQQFCQIVYFRFFCQEMMHMMTENFRQWKSKTDRIKESTKRPGWVLPWPDHLPKFLGYITSIFQLPNSTPEASSESGSVSWASEAGTGIILF